jgi:uncharacterized protein (DUF885 family)
MDADLNIGRRGVVAGMLASAALPSVSLAQVASTASAKARALYDRLFDAVLTANPAQATSLGLDTGTRAALRGQLASTARANRFGSATLIANAGPELRAIDATALTEEERTWLETMRWHATRRAEIVKTPYGGFTGYPIPYTLTHLTGSYQGTPDFLDSQHPVSTSADAEAYLSRLNDFAANIGHDVDRARADMAMGVIPPAFVLDKAIGQTRGLGEQQRAGKGMAAVLARKAAAAKLDGDWGARAAKIVDGPIAAALARQLALLTEMRGKAGTEAGVSRLPGGPAFYAMCLRQHTTTSLTPDAAHKIGLAEVRDYQARLEPLLRAAGLTTGTVGARLTALGKRPDQLYPNTDAGRDAILAYANAKTAEIRPLLPRWFDDLPASQVEIRRVPVAIEAGAPRGYAQSGTLDGSRPGAFYINLRDTHIWPRFSLPTLIYHEGLPGHVMEGAAQLASKTIPMLHRTMGIAAYGEGWGLYAEQLADEMGVYADEPLGRIGYLQAALYRAVRVVVDTGMHAKGWSRDRARQYMIDITGLAPGAAENEIDRYIVWPGQATSYKLGHTAIVRAREAAKARLGAKFDIRGFHRVVLGRGDQPLDLLARNVAAWDGS